MKSNITEPVTNIYVRLLLLLVVVPAWSLTNFTGVACLSLFNNVPHSGGDGMEDSVIGGQCGSSPHPEAQNQGPLPIYIFVVNGLGCVLLAALVISVSLSNRLHRRDPVVNNFLYTWILLSALASFE